MSLTDPIDCLPFPWTGGACLPRTTNVVAADWINLLTLEQVVALWSRVEQYEIFVTVIAQQGADDLQINSTGPVEAQTSTPTDRICNTINFFALKNEFIGNPPRTDVFAGSRYRTLSTLQERAGIREIVTTTGQIFYTSPIGLIASALAQDVDTSTFFAQEVVEIGTFNTTTLPTIIADGTITIAGVDLQWIRYRETSGDLTGVTVSVSDPTVSETLWTFDGTIN